MTPSATLTRSGPSGAHISGLAPPSLDKSSGNITHRFKLPALPGRFPSCDPMHSRVNWGGVNRVRSPLSFPAPSLARLKIYDDAHVLLTHLSKSAIRNSDDDRGQVACVQKGFARKK